LKFLRNQWSHFGENEFGNIRLKARERDVKITLEKIFGGKKRWTY